MRFARLVLVGALAAALLTMAAPISTAAAAASSTDLVGPAGSSVKFGASVPWSTAVLVLTNGNIVVADYLADNVATDAGAVYLYSGTAPHALISTLTGASANDRVGSSGVVEVGSSNFVVASPAWNASGSSVGAATWVSGSVGLAGAVGPGNSIVGSHAGDAVGSLGVVSSVVPLADGNYVVGAPEWDNDAISNAGAARWANGNASSVGPITPGNSVVGTQANDHVGRRTVSLNDGDYVVLSAGWNNDAITEAGAATWARGGLAGPRTVGPVTITNSLVGTHPLDHVGVDAVALTNDNYVVISSGYRGFDVIAGAVTLQRGDGSGPYGDIPGDSIVGTHYADQVGQGGVVPLANGNFVVLSPLWNGPKWRLGAVTWGSGTTGSPGVVGGGTDQSLLGTTDEDAVGAHGVTALPSGNFVVSSQYWDDGATVDAGAVTWVNGATGMSGTPSAANSLIGPHPGDGVGGVNALTTGDYVVTSPGWDNGATPDVGAVTWIDGSTGLTGPVTAVNSLTGGALAGDGLTMATTALSNGNYVVNAPAFDTSPLVDVGATAWVNGSTGRVGTLGVGGSIIGTHAGDGTTSSVTALTNGNYVLASPLFDAPDAVDGGAATWASGTGPTTLSIGPSNSLVGSHASDEVSAEGVTALDQGLYSVASHVWDNGASVNAGALTFGTAHGVTGAITPANSAIGAAPADPPSTSIKRRTSGGEIVVPHPARKLVTLYRPQSPSFASTPADISVDAPIGASGTPVTFATPAATDLFDNPATVQCAPASGSVFPIGATTVTCTATDVEQHTAAVTFSVTAHDTTPPPDPEPPVEYLPLTPARLADSRGGGSTVDGQFAAGGALTAGSTLTLRVAGRGGVPADAIAASLNVTVTEAAAGGFMTVFPCGSAQPTASNLNYTSSSTTPNAVIAKIGTNGDVCIFTQSTVQLIVDVNGAFPPTTSYVPQVPARVIDTRPGQTTVDGQAQGAGAVAAGSDTEIQITGRAGVPADATAVALNVTITDPIAAGYATVHPCGSPAPTASNLNYSPGQTVPNLVVAKVGASGKVCVFTQSGTNLIADVGGYFPTASGFTALDPARLIDTRPGSTTVDGSGVGLGVRPTGSITVVQVGGRGGVDVDAATAVLNVTATNPAAPGFVTVYACSTAADAPPLASNLNFGAGDTVANAVITGLGPTGKVCLYNSQPTDLIADANGYFH